MHIRNFGKRGDEMRIMQFSARNVKGIRVIELHPEGENVVLSGGNGAGKSSVLDAITTTLAGGALPVRRGTDKGEVRIEIGPYVVTRMITEKTDRVVVRASDGEALPEPRTMLKKLVGPLAIDPVAFCTLKPRDQVELLFGLLPGLRPTLRALDKKLEEYKATRAAINAEIGRMNATFPEFPSDLPSEPVDLEKLTKLQQRVVKQLSSAERASADLKSVAAQIEEQERVIAAAQEKLHSLQLRHSELDDEVKRTPKELRQQLKEISDQVTGAAELNQQIQERDRVEELKKLHLAKREEYNDLLFSMKNAEAEKAEVLGAAKLPLKGLGVDEDGVYYGGVPVQDLSTSERVRVGAAIAVAQNPTARIIIADDASLLDSASMAVLRKVCKDFQIWTVLNDETGHAGIWIEDGAIREE